MKQVCGIQFILTEPSKYYIVTYIHCNPTMRIEILNETVVTIFVFSQIRNVNDLCFTKCQNIWFVEIEVSVYTVYIGVKTTNISEMKFERFITAGVGK